MGNMTDHLGDGAPSQREPGSLSAPGVDLRETTIPYEVNRQLSTLRQQMRAAQEEQDAHKMLRNAAQRREVAAYEQMKYLLNQNHASARQMRQWLNSD